MKERSYQGLFHPDYWSQLNLDQRVGVLKDLESDYAKRCGRKRFDIKAVEMPNHGSCGEFDPDTRTIKVNAAHIQHPTMYLSAIQTVLHEGRHAYQQAVIDGDVKHDDPYEAQTWKKNSSVYISNSQATGIVYRNQPIERDAENFANKEFQEIFGHLERIQGRIEPFRRYFEMIDAEAQFVAEMAAAKYGPNYAADIEKAIHKAHEQKEAVVSAFDPRKKVHLQTFGGKISHVGKDWVYQESENGFVKHERKLFDAEPRVGDFFKVGYRRGVGRVEGRISEKEVLRLGNARGKRR